MVRLKGNRSEFEFGGWLKKQERVIMRLLERARRSPRAEMARGAYRLACPRERIDVARELREVENKRKSEDQDCPRQQELPQGENAEECRKLVTAKSGRNRMLLPAPYCFISETWAHLQGQHTDATGAFLEKRAGR